MADGVAGFGALLTGVVLLGVVAAGAVLAAGELLAPLGVALLAGLVAAAPVVLAGGVGDGLAGAALPTARRRGSAMAGLSWTTADSGLPAAPSSKVTARAQPMKAVAMNAAGPAQRRPGRPCRPARRPCPAPCPGDRGDAVARLTAVSRLTAVAG